jgi:lipase maturation factor 1
MKNFAARLAAWWVEPGPAGPPGHLVPRWLFLRALGVIYFSAFYSLLFQIRGMLGPQGLLPTGSYLEEVGKAMGRARYWYAPTLLWFASGDHALTSLCWVGLIASVLLFVNFWPRGMLTICFVCFLSFIAGAQDFSGYQSDGMLLCAGFISYFLTPRGWRPGWGEQDPPARASLFLLRLLWFTIYFESGVAKYFGGDPTWRDLSAMNQYYQNGPLPTWVGWYAHQFPHWFHHSTAFVTLCLELLVPWMLWLPRRARIVCFFVVTFLQVGIILTANYAFLNYLVLALGIFLLDDVFLVRFLATSRCNAVRTNLQHASAGPWYASLLKSFEGPTEPVSLLLTTPTEEASKVVATANVPERKAGAVLTGVFEGIALCTKTFLLLWVFYAMAFLMLQQISPGLPLPAKPVAALDPFRIANSYGLFGRMTWARYEIEFQGSNDGENWVAYPFRYKPQNLNEAPGIYAPYQPRFEWNLWFASLGTWRENPFVIRTEEQLLLNTPHVLALFRSNPFAQAPPKFVRSVVWQYWFTDRTTKRATGQWWRREFRGIYAPTLERTSEGKIIVAEWPQTFIPPP